MSISILSPVFNEEQDLQDCLDSVQNSGTHISEHLVYDNASIDDTARILFTNASKNLTVLSRMETRSPVLNWLEIVGLVNSDFVFTLGGDDKLASGALRRLKPLMAEPNLGVLYFRFENFDDSTGLINGRSPSDELLTGIQNCFYCGLWILLTNISIDEWGLGIHAKSLFRKASMLNLDASHSFFWWLGILGYLNCHALGLRIVVDNKVTILKRQGSMNKLNGDFKFGSKPSSLKILKANLKNVRVVTREFKGSRHIKLYFLICLGLANTYLCNKIWSGISAISYQLFAFTHPGKVCRTIVT